MQVVIRPYLINDTSLPFLSSLGPDYRKKRANNNK